MTFSRRHFNAALSALCGGGLVASVAAEQRPLRFGVVPQKPPAQLATGWAPLLSWVAERSGVGLEFGTGRDIPAFERRLGRREYGFAYMNPFHYAVFHRTAGYQVLAHEAERMLRGVVVVRRDAPLRDLQALDGSVMAFPAPAAFAATVLPLGELSRRAITVSPRYVNSHNSVYLAVAAGLYPAGGGVVATLEAMPADLRDQLRILWTSRPYTPHAFAVRDDVDRTVAQRVRDALVEAGSDGEGRRLLAAVGLRTLKAARDDAYDDVRALPLKQLASLLRD